MADEVQWHAQRVAAFVLFLLYVNRRRRNRKRWNKRKVWTKPYISRNLTLEACVYTLQTKRPTDLDNSELPRWIESYTFVYTSVRHFVKCHANHVYRARGLIGWQSPTQVCQPFTRQIRVYQHEKVGEKVGENRGKFYLSPTVCQSVCRQFLCRSHTPTWVCQHEFANFSLPCEGRFTSTKWLKQVQIQMSLIKRRLKKHLNSF